MEMAIETSQHKIASALYSLRLELNAARALLSDDRAIARPLPRSAITQTPFWGDALSIAKAHANRSLRDAHAATLRVMGLVGPRSESELGTLVSVIKENVEWAYRCLCEHGNSPNNDDRMAAALATETAWTLTTIAIRLFHLQAQDFKSVGAATSRPRNATGARKSPSAPTSLQGGTKIVALFQAVI